mgnify:CR=1 FL=1
MEALTRRVVKGICLVAIAAFVVGVAVIDVQAKDYKWKISQGIAEDHPAAARCKQYAKLVEEKSGGRIKMTYFPGNTSESFTITCEDTPPFTSPPTPLWTGIYLITHQAEMDMTGGGFLVEGWEIIGDEFFAKKEWILESASDGVVEAGPRAVPGELDLQTPGVDAGVDARRRRLRQGPGGAGHLRHLVERRVPRNRRGELHRDPETLRSRNSEIPKL